MSSDTEQRIEKLEAEGEALREKIRIKLEAQNDKTCKREREREKELREMGEREMDG